MSFYQQGLHAPMTGHSILTPYRERASQVWHGARLMHAPHTRFYKQGIEGRLLKRPEMVIGGLMSDSLIPTIMDMVHILLLLAGAYMLVTAIM